MGKEFFKYGKNDLKRHGYTLSGDAGARVKVGFSGRLHSFKSQRHENPGQEGPRKKGLVVLACISAYLQQVGRAQLH